MPRSGEYKTVQSRILAYAQEIELAVPFVVSPSNHERIFSHDR